MQTEKEEQMVKAIVEIAKEMRELNRLLRIIAEKADPNCDGQLKYLKRGL